MNSRKQIATHQKVTNPVNLVPTLEEVWRDYRRTRKIAQSTMHKYDYSLRAYLADWLPLPMDCIKKQLIEVRHAEVSLKNGPGVANHAFRVLKCLFNYAQLRYDDLDGAPLIKNNPVKILNNNGWNRENPKNSYIRRDQYQDWYQAVLSINNEVARDYFLFIAFTGCRKSEAAKLLWEDVSFDLKQVVFRNTKNHKDHAIPVCALLMAILTKRLQKRTGGRYVFETKNHRMYTNSAPDQKRVAGRYGQSWVLHDLRRSWATLAHAYGLDFLTIKRMLNHADRDVTWRYIVHDPERYRAEVEGMGLYLMQAMNIDQLEAIHQTTLPVHRVAVSRPPLKLIEGVSLNEDQRRIQKNEKRRLVSLQKAWYDFKDNSDHRESTLETWEETFLKAFKPLLSRSIAAITTIHLECSHRKGVEEWGETTADFALVILGEVFDFAMREYHISESVQEFIVQENPVSQLLTERVVGKISTSSQPYLKTDQIRKWALAVESESESQSAKDYLFFLLFTGITPRQAAQLMWSGIDYDQNTILVNGQQIPLHPWLGARFMRRQEIALGREYVFASKSDSEYRLPETIKSRIQRKCGIQFESMTISKTYHMLASLLGYMHPDHDQSRAVHDVIFRHLGF